MPLPQASASPPLGDLPLRVVPQADGSCEVVDGLKRLARWAAAGLTHVPVVVEEARSSAESKALLLRTNAPPRTLTAMDEARVIDSLVHEDGLTLTDAARLLGRRTAWVTRRHALAERLAPAAQEGLDHRRIGPSLAYALTPLSDPDQEKLLQATLRHHLKQREALTLVAAWRATDSEREHAALVRDPLAVVRPQPEGPSPIGPLATRLEERLARMQQALLELSTFALPDAGLTDAERRRLEAQHVRLLDQLETTARALLAPTTIEPREDPRDDPRRQDTAPPECNEEAGEETEAPDPPGAPADPPPAPAGLRHPPDRRAHPAQPQARPEHPGRGGPQPASGAAAEREQARPLPRSHPGEGGAAPHDHPHPAAMERVESPSMSRMASW
jgi:ParB-like chromosome segregation protein Spo0J